MQRHHRDKLQIHVTGGTAAAGRLAGRARAIVVAAFMVSRMPGPDQLAPGTEDPVAGLGDRERGELVTALDTAQVTGVIPGQAAQSGQGKAALVPASAQFRAPAVDS